MDLEFLVGVPFSALWCFWCVGVFVCGAVDGLCSWCWDAEGEGDGFVFCCFFDGAVAVDFHVVGVFGYCVVAFSVVVYIIVFEWWEGAVEDDAPGYGCFAGCGDFDFHACSVEDVGGDFGCEVCYGVS